MELYLTWFLQMAERLEGGREFHPVVCRMDCAAGQLFAVGFVHEKGRPAAGAGITATGAVRINGYVLHDRVS